MKRLQIPQKLVHVKCYVHKKILRTRTCRRKFIKNLRPEKRKENMQTKRKRNGEKKVHSFNDNNKPV